MNTKDTANLLDELRLSLDEELIYRILNGLRLANDTKRLPEFVNYMRLWTCSEAQEHGVELEPFEHSILLLVAAGAHEEIAEDIDLIVRTLAIAAIASPEHLHQFRKIAEGLHGELKQVLSQHERN